MPLVIAPGLLFFFDVTPKVVILLSVTGICLFFTNANAAGLSALRGCREGRWLIYLLLGQALSILVATIFAPDIRLAVTGSAWRRCGAVAEIGILVFTILLAGRIASVQNSVLVVFRFIAVSCLLVSFYGISQYFGIDPFLPTQSYHAGEGIFTIVRPPSTMGNANFLANYLLYASFCSLVLFRRNVRDGWSWLAAGAFGSAMIAIVLSGTRSGILGLLTAMALLVLGARSRIRNWIIGAGLGAAVLIAIVAVSPAGLPLRARVHWSRDDVLGGGRLLLWRDTGRMIAARAFTGFGPDQFSRVFPGFQSVDLAMVHPDFYQESPHNEFLDSAAATGIPGLLLSAAFLVLGFAAAWRIRRVEPGLALCLAAGLAGGTVCGQFSPPVMVTCVYQSVLIAILCASACRTRPDPAIAPAFVRPLCWAAGSGFVLFATALLISDLMAAYFKSSLDAGRVESAVRRYAIVSKYSLPGFDIDSYASRSLAELSQKEAPVLTRALAWREAKQAAARAVRTAEDRQNAFYNLARLCALENDAAGTEQNLRSAIQAAPSWFKPHWVLAELLMRTGRIPEARREAVLAIRADAGKDPGVVRTWNALGSPR
jgi:O-antigen ligase